MRQVREVLRLKYECKESARAIARSIGGVGRTAVTDYLGRFEASGLSWPLPADLDDEALEARLFPPPPPGATRVVPDFARMDVELRRKGVTLQLLWTEYGGAVHGRWGLRFGHVMDDLLHQPQAFLGRQRAYSGQQFIRPGGGHGCNVAHLGLGGHGASGQGKVCLVRLL